MEDKLEQERQFIGMEEQYIILPAVNLYESPAEGGFILELSLQQFDAATKHRFSEVYSTRSQIYLQSVDDFYGPANTEYKAVIRRNDNNVLRLLLLGGGHYLNRNLHKIRATREWTIRTAQELNKFDEQLLKFYQSGAYRSCVGFPHMLKSFGLRELDTVVKGSGESSKEIELSEELNDSQKTAILAALDEQQEFVAIHGPPGTGKTRVLAEIVYQQTLNKKTRIIVCAPSNKAVDNALIACLGRGVPADKCTRLGFSDSDNEKISSTHFFAMFKQHQSSYEDQNVHDGENENKMRHIIKRSEKLEKSIEKSIIRDIQIIFCTATCNAVFRFLRNGLFQPDLIIMDEGAQIFEPTTWHMLLNAPRFVLVGDHKQLEPVIHIEKTTRRSDHPFGNFDEDWTSRGEMNNLELAKRMSVTLLQRLATDVLRGKQGHLHLLDVNYRSNALINRWSNQHFYEGRLSAHQTVQDITLADIVQREPNSSRVVGKTNGDGAAQNEGTEQFFIQEPLVLVDTAEFTEKDRQECLQLYPPILLDFIEQKKRGTTSSYNIGEALCAVHHLLALKKIGGLQAEDFGCITPYLAQTKLIKKFLGAHNFDVSSVDAFQGQQREAIVMSFVRSNYEDFIGFMENLNRMNVAITRAKRQVLLIASSRSLKSNETLHELYKLIQREGRIVNPKELLLNSPFKFDIIQQSEAGGRTRYGNRGPN